MSACPSPIAFETLVAWWTGELGDDEAARVEEHLFACDACGEASARFAELASGFRDLIPPVISHGRRDRLVAEGSRIRFTDVQAGVDATALFGADVDMLVHVLHADLAGAERVDVEIVMPGWKDPVLWLGVPFDPAAGEVLISCQRHYQHIFPADPLFRVHVFRGGERTHVGDYFVRHVVP